MLGEAVAQRRQALGLSIHRLSALSGPTGPSVTMISLIESGQRSPSLRTLLALSVPLHCNFVVSDGETRLEVPDEQREQDG